MEDYLIEGIRNHIHEVGGIGRSRTVEIKPGYCAVEVEALEDMSNVYLQVHGGVLMTLCDMAATCAGYAAGKSVITLSSNFNFIRGFACDGRTMRIEAKVVHNGGRTMMVETTIFNDKGQVCVRNSTGMFVVKKVEPGDRIPVAPSPACEFLPDIEELRKMEL